MIHVTCRLTAKNRDQLRNPTLGNRVSRGELGRICKYSNFPPSLICSVVLGPSVACYRGPLLFKTARRVVRVDFDLRRCRGKRVSPGRGIDFPTPRMYVLRPGRSGVWLSVESGDCKTCEKHVFSGRAKEIFAIVRRWELDCVENARILQCEAAVVKSSYEQCV